MTGEHYEYKDVISRIEKCYCLSEEQKHTWEQLFIFLEHNCKCMDEPYPEFFARVSAFIFIPSLLHLSFRNIFIKYFESKDVFPDALKSWLSEDINIKSRLLRDILVTQKIKFSENFLDAVDFFTKEKKFSDLHRNMASHNLISALDIAKKIPTIDIYKRIETIMIGLVELDRYVQIILIKKHRLQPKKKYYLHKRNIKICHKYCLRNSSHKQ